MASSGQVVEAVADAFGLAVETVASHVRLLREADRITTGGRGRSAASLSWEDIARVILASVGSEQVKDGPSEASNFFALPVARGGGSPGRQVGRGDLDKHAPFNRTASPDLGRALAALVASSVAGNLSPAIPLRPAKFVRPARERPSTLAPTLSLTLVHIHSVIGRQTIRLALLAQEFPGGARAYRTFQPGDLPFVARFRDMAATAAFTHPEGARVVARAFYLASLERLGATLRMSG